MCGQEIEAMKQTNEAGSIYSDVTQQKRSTHLIDVYGREAVWKE